MEKEDFEYEHDQFRGELGKLAYAYKRIKERLLQNFEHWQELGTSFFNNQVSFEIGVDGESLQGIVAGKKFAISFTPVALENDNYALAVVTVVDLVSKLPSEIDRFLISINGDVLSMEKVELLSSEDEAQSFKLLIAVVRRVIRAIPAQV